MSELTYYDYINSFFELLKVNPPSSNAQLLYHTLLMEYNNARWQSVELHRTNSYIGGLCGLGEKALTNAKNELKQLGLIDFTSPKKKPTIYKLLPVKNTGQTAGETQVKRKSNASQRKVKGQTYKDKRDKTEDKDLKESKKKNLILCKQIIDYLNERAGTAYRSDSVETQKHINARLSEGYTLDDFKKAINNKCAEWCGTEMQTYLRPQTLFGTKFEGYVNSLPVANKNTYLEVYDDSNFDYAGLEKIMQEKG